MVQDSYMPNKEKPKGDRRHPPPADREPTQDELAPVMAMGYEPEMASAALRMAHFRADIAAEILLGDGIMKVFELIA
jgi:hypothetical protein